MNQPLVPLCLVHSVPHPCVECRQAVPDAAVRALDRLAENRPLLKPLREIEADQDNPDNFDLQAGGRLLAEQRAAIHKYMEENGIPRRDDGPVVRFKRFHDRAVIPEYAKPGDAGADLRAVESVRLKPFEPVKVRLGVGIELPPGYEAQLRPRSSMSAQGVYAAFGTIDQGYRGEICAVLTLLNRGYADYEIHIGDKVAQLVVAPVARATFVEGELGESERGAGGFGSTGRR